MSHNTEHYFTDGKYDAFKSERRKRQIQQGNPAALRQGVFTPRGINTHELLRQKTLRSSEASQKLMETAMTRQ